MPKFIQQNYYNTKSRKSMPTDVREGYNSAMHIGARSKFSRNGEYININCVLYLFKLINFWAIHKWGCFNSTVVVTSFRFILQKKKKKNFVSLYTIEWFMFQFNSVVFLNLMLHYIAITVAWWLRFLETIVVKQWLGDFHYHNYLIATDF